VICLDTNYLIMGLVRNSREMERILAWAENGERFSVSSIVWYEFACGPVTRAQISAMRDLVDEVVPFDVQHAEESARLFNAVGRRRQLRVDAMIAATAVLRDVPLATGNQTDFTPFAEHGLRLLD
jgi:predicted nucleic acid-binding protein